MGEVASLYQEEERLSYHQGQGTGGREIWKRFVHFTFFLVISPLPTPNPNPFVFPVLHKFTCFFVSKVQNLPVLITSGLYSLVKTPLYKQKFSQACFLLSCSSLSVQLPHLARDPKRVEKNFFLLTWQSWSVLGLWLHRSNLCLHHHCICILSSSYKDACHWIWGPHLYNPGCSWESFFYDFFFSFSASTQLAGSQFPDQRLNPGHGSESTKSFTTGPLGNSLKGLNYICKDPITSGQRSLWEKRLHSTPSTLPISGREDWPEQTRLQRLHEQITHSKGGALQWKVYFLVAPLKPCFLLEPHCLTRE